MIKSHEAAAGKRFLPSSPSAKSALSNRPLALMRWFGLLCAVICLGLSSGCSGDDASSSTKTTQSSPAAGAESGAASASDREKTKEVSSATTKAADAAEKITPQPTLPEVDTTGFTKTASGLFYKIVKEGDGPLPKVGQTVRVHYTGKLSNNFTFDSSEWRGEPISFLLGEGRVIKGWDEGVALLKVGSKAQFVIPPGLGYGAAGVPPSIPPNATLIFDVELLGAK